MNARSLLKKYFLHSWDYNYIVSSLPFPPSNKGIVRALYKKNNHNIVTHEKKWRLLSVTCMLICFLFPPCACMRGSYRVCHVCAWWRWRVFSQCLGSSTELHQPDFKLHEKDHAMKKYNCQCFHGNQHIKMLFSWRGLFILFYFNKNLSRITLWDVTFYFHKHIQGVRESPILYSLKTELLQCLLDFSKCHFQPILCTNGLHSQENTAKKREKKETVSKCSIKYYYVESHSGQKAFPPAFYPFKHPGCRVSVWYGKAHL